MVSRHRNKLSIKNKSLHYKLLIVEALIFVLPCVILFYVFYRDHIFIKAYQLIIFAFILLLILAGLIILRQIFDRFIQVSALVRNAVADDADGETLEKDKETLHDITVSFNRLMQKFEETNTELKRRVFELFAIKEITEVASKSIDIEKLLAMLLKKTMALTGAKIGSIFMVDTEKGRFRVLSSKGLNSGPANNAYIKINASLARHVVAEKKPLLVENIEKDGRFRNSNYPGYGSLSFLSLPVFIRQKLIAVLNLAHKEDQHAFDAQDEQILSVMIGEIGFALENAQLHCQAEKDLKKLEERSLQLATANSKLQHEIIERKETESQLQHIKKDWEITFNAISDWVSLIDLNRCILRSNFAGVDFVHLPLENMEGQNCCKLIHGAKQPIPQCPLKKMLKTHRRESLELYVPDEDRWLMIIVDPVKDKDGKMMRAVHIVRDITHQKKMEGELQKSQKLESIGTLAGGIAHDFNNLLLGILGNIELSKLQATPENKLYKNLISAENACGRAKQLTQQFITFSKGGAPAKKIGSVEKMIQDSVNLALAGSNLKNELSVSEDLWSVEFDEDQMKQAVNELLSNANEAMPEGGTVYISVKNVNINENSCRVGMPVVEGRYVQLVIRDNGTGIHKNDLAKIFDPYFSTKPRGTQKGMGLGLTTTYSIIKSHGGYIDIKSKPGLGTTVKVYLPVADPKKGPEILPDVEPILGPATILFMDDDEMVKEIAGQILSLSGHDVIFAKDGLEAVDLYQQAMESEHPFDAVVLDLTVRGGMGGKEAMKRLMEIDPQVKAIVSSGYSDDPVVTDFRKYGFSSVAIKPYNVEILNKAIHDVLAKGVIEHAAA